MTVIVWSRKHLIMAADRQSVDAGLCRATTKIRRLSKGGLIATAGDSAMGHRLEHWFKDGRDADKWPDPDVKAKMLYVDLDGQAWIFDGGPFPDLVDELWVAIGAGQDFAMGALAQGANPVEAVEIANNYCCHCGLGYDSLALFDDDNLPF